MTRTTIAAFPIVEAKDGRSRDRLLVFSRYCTNLLTHSHDVSFDVVTKGEVAGNCNQHVYRACNAYTRNDNSGCSKVGVVVDFVEDGKHLGEPSLDFAQQNRTPNLHSGDKCRRRLSQESCSRLPLVRPTAQI